MKQKQEKELNFEKALRKVMAVKYFEEEIISIIKEENDIKHIDVISRYGGNLICFYKQRDTDKLLILCRSNKRLPDNYLVVSYLHS